MCSTLVSQRSSAPFAPRTITFQKAQLQVLLAGDISGRVAYGLPSMLHSLRCNPCLWEVWSLMMLGLDGKVQLLRSVPVGMLQIPLLHNIQLPGSKEPGSRAPGRTLETQREHADTMPNPEMESKVRALGRLDSAFAHLVLHPTNLAGLPSSVI